MEVCLPDVGPGDLSLQYTFPSRPCSLLSHPYHPAGSYLLHACPHFLLNKMLPLFALDVVNPGHWEVAYACTPCCYGPHQCLLSQPWLSHNVCSEEFKRVGGGDVVSIYLYGYFGIRHASEVNNEFLGFGCIKQKVIVCAPSDSLGHLNAVLGFIIVGDETYNGCVVCVFDCFYRTVLGCKVSGVQWEEPVGENTVLRSSCTECRRVWG